MIRQGDILSGRYQIMEKIGQGGTGIVYKAYDRNLQKYVVLKKIKDHFAGQLNDRIEVDILKRLHHPYLPQVYDFISLDSQIFTVMDYIDGKELKWFGDHGYVLDEKTIRKWLEQLLEVLGYLHAQVPKIIHGDIKPANIMVTANGDICLIDFNISLGDGDLSAILGVSEAYGAPEQVKKAALARQGRAHQMILLDERTDIYSLGKSFRVQMEEGAREGALYSEALWDIVGKAMQEDPDKRYQNAEKMLYAVRNIEKSDKQYRKYFMTGLLIHIGYALCMILAVLLIFAGYQMKGKEEFQEAYSRLEQSVRAEQAEDMVDEGIRIVNMPGFKKQKSRMSREAYSVFHAIGDGYYLQGEYESASEYYELALESGGGEEEAYYLDYGTALARAGKAALAREVLEDARGSGVREDYLELIDSEILREQGERAGALEVLGKVVNSSQEASIQAYLRMADMHEEDGDMADAIACMEKAVERVPGTSAVRRLGNLYHQAGRDKEAAKCFRSLLDGLQPAYEDYINYGVCCESSGNYSEAIPALKEAAASFPDRYEAYMHLAFSSYKLGKEETAKNYYEMASEKYRREKEQDTMMQELESILG